jgi:hypothetical protein
MTKTRSLNERLIIELMTYDWGKRAPAVVVEWVCKTQQAMQQEVTPPMLAAWSKWDETACATMLRQAGVDPHIPDSQGGRVFQRWLELAAKHRGWQSKKRTWTTSEQRFISNALTQASEDDLLNMLEWAFHGTDQYATFLQGKTVFNDKDTPSPHLGIEALFKEKNLDKRLDLGRGLAERRVATSTPAEYGAWLQDEAMPALHALVSGPEDYAAAYDWWAERRGRDDRGPAHDMGYISALQALRTWRNERGL